MRVVFCDNVLIDGARPDAPFDAQPHLGLLSLLAVTLNQGHEGSIFDPSLALMRGTLQLGETFYRDLAWNLLDHDPDILGFTTLGCNLICTCKVATHVKRQRPDLPIMVGGPHATILHREMLRSFDVFDVVVRNEAESTLPAVLDAMAAGASWADELSDVPGLTFWRGEELLSTRPSPLIEDLDQLPWPAYEHYPIETLGLSSIRVEAGRGCPFSCTFCSTASFFGRRYRLKSPVRLIAELDFLHASYGISDFALTHDMFTANKNKVRGFCNAVGDRGYTWSCSARMDCVDPALLATMYEAGCRSIYYGVETGSRRMQKISDKHMDLDLVEPVLDVTARVGMKAVVSMITGFPEETEEDQAATLDLLGDCLRRSPQQLGLQLHLLTPEPGTALYQQYADRLSYDGYVTDFNFATLEEDDDAVMSSAPELFMTHHYYATVLPRRQHVFAERSFQLLLHLGFPLLRRMLRDFDGRLSHLVRTLRSFAGDEARTLDLRALSAFARHHWGPVHPVTSAVRFLVAGNQLRRRVLTAPLPDHAGSYRLDPSTALLRDIHDVPALLAALDQEPTTLDDERCGRVLDGLLLFVQQERPHDVRAFEVDGVALALVEWLIEPRASADLARWLAQFDGNALVLKKLAERLCNIGVVVSPAEVGER